MGPEIVITTDETAVNNQAIAALAHDPDIYQRGTILVHVVPQPAKPKGVRRPDGTPTIVPIRRALLQERMSKAARWCALSAKDELVSAHPPKWSIEAILQRGIWSGLRHLEGVVFGPVLRADGTILARPGYDAETGLLSYSSVSLAGVPENPTASDLKQAIAILDDAIHDFPFASPGHRAAWYALLLTIVSRHAFSGPAPLTVIDANIAASGKGLLVDLTTTIAIGRRPSRLAYSPSDEEIRKLITSLAIAGDSLVLIDNVEGAFGSPALDAALTATSWNDRLLGRSEIVEMPLRVTWMSTANNAFLKGDLARRVLHSRLRSEVDNPEQRTGFRHPNLIAWATENRPTLLGAVFTILRAYIAAGRPNLGLPAWGSFEEWSDLVRNAIVYAGLPDPAETREDLRRRSDIEGQGLSALLMGLQLLDPDQSGLTASEILATVTDPEKSRKESAQMIREALLQICRTTSGGLPNAQSIGMTLHHLRERPCQGMCLDKRDRHGTSAWFVRHVAGGTSGASGTNLPRTRAKNSGPKSTKSQTKIKRKAGENSPTSSPSPTQPKQDVAVF